MVYDTLDNKPIDDIIEVDGRETRHTFYSFGETFLHYLSSRSS